MEKVFDFILAALPWLVIGLFIAVFCVRIGIKKKDEAAKDDYGLLGMCLGMSIGSAVGIILKNHIGICISLGLLIGFTVGTCIKKESNGGGNGSKE